MSISIYPPILQSTQSAFLATEKSYNIYFTLQNVTSFNSIGHIQIRVIDQQSNVSVVSTSKYPDGIIYKAAAAIKQDGDNYSISIDSVDLKTTWQEGRLYKIQVRFGTTSLWGDNSNFAAWKKDQINNQTFSEWSTVMIIKPIATPTVEITNQGELRQEQDVEDSINVENTTIPLFTGSCSFSDRTRTFKTEYLDKYIFNLYDYSSEELLETSGELQVEQNLTICSYRFKTVLNNNQIYYVTFKAITNNGYEATVGYKFQVVETYLDAIENLEMKVYGNDDVYCKENGCLKIALNHTKPNESLTGCYVLTRTSEKSDYKIYEVIKYFHLFENVFSNETLFLDYTVESGIRYKYGFQYENSEGIRSAVIGQKAPQYVDFEYSYLYRDDIQLRLMFNQKLSSFKHTTLSSKQDTLGDKYPHLVRNGYAKYAEFPISGTISFHMDEDQTFFREEKDGYYYGNELILSKDKFEEDSIRGSNDSTGIIFNTSLTADNVFIERKFREKAEEFLNDFTYKLYKSPTEGNIVIGLMNISMTPNATLGRMIFDFSATAYEVMDNTLEKLNEIGIIDIGSPDVEATTNEKSLSFGQIAGVYNNTKASYPEDKDIYKLIQQEEEKEVGGGQFKLKLNQLNSFWVERYPDINLQGQIDKFKANGEVELAKRYEKLSDTMSESALSSYVRLRVNGAEVLVAPNKYYSVNEGITSLEIEFSPYPIIINYVAALERVENTDLKVVTKIDVSKVWGQISGVFTTDASILKRYNYAYVEQNTSRVYSKAALVDDEYSYVIADDTTYNLYKTKNLYEIIQEETRKLVAYIYKVKDGFYQDEDGNWTDGEIYYTFSDIISFTIEADPYTELKVGQDEESAETVLLGSTGRYTLSPIESMVKYIELPQAQFAIVDFKCTTTQTVMR